MPTCHQFLRRRFGLTLIAGYFVSCFRSRVPFGRPSRVQQRGVLLVESAVAVLVFSVGVLGAVALQAQSRRHLSEAQSRAEAADLADALLAKMWADDPAQLAQRYDSAQAATAYREFAWRATRLPGGTAADNALSVNVTAGPSSSSRSVNILLRWRAPGEAQAHQYSIAAIIGRN